MVHRPVFRIELVEQLSEKPMTAAPLKLHAESVVDLSGKALIFPLELFNQVLVQ